MQPLRPEMIIKQGAFRLLRLLGSGGQAQVWRAIKITEAFGLEMQIALKMMRLDQMQDTHLLKQRLLSFREEARLSECLRHSQHFVRVHNAFEDKEHALLGLEMEIVEGMDLFDLLHEHRETRKTPIPWPIALSIGAQIFEGLHHAHTATLDHQPLHLIHRDLKPQNLMLSTTGLVKIIDLGIAKWEQRDKALQTLEAKPKGSFAYMAPEQALYAQISPQSDIFAAAAVLYEIITGQAPFQPNLYHEHLIRLAKLAEQPIPSAKQIIPHLPEAISSYFDTLLAPDPARRPQDALRVRQDLEALCRQGEHSLYGPTEIQAWLSSLLRGESKSLSKVSWYGLSAYSDTLAQTPEEFASHHKRDTVQQAVWSSSSLPLDPNLLKNTNLSKESLSALPSLAPTHTLPSPTLGASSLPSHRMDGPLPFRSRGWLVFGALVLVLGAAALGRWFLRSEPQISDDPRLAHTLRPLAPHPVRGVTSPPLLRTQSSATLARSPAERRSMASEPPVRQNVPLPDPSTREEASVDASSSASDPPPSPTIRYPQRRSHPRRNHLPKARHLARVPSRNTKTRPSIASNNRPHPTNLSKNTPPTIRVATSLREPVVPIVQKATLIVQISPFPCQLRSQKDSYGKQTRFVLRLEAGHYRFRCIHRQKFFLWTFSVALSAGGVHRVEKHVEMGQVFIRSKPWSSVLLEPFGEIGQSHASISLPSGAHDLTLYREGQSTQVRKLAIVIAPHQITQPPFVRW